MVGTDVLPVGPIGAFTGVDLPVAGRWQMDSPLPTATAAPTFAPSSVSCRDAVVLLRTTDPAVFSVHGVSSWPAAFSDVGSDVLPVPMVDVGCLAAAVVAPVSGVS
jgi:hypothetical protein